MTHTCVVHTTTCAMLVLLVCTPTLLHTYLCCCFISVTNADLAVYSPTGITLGISLLSALSVPVSLLCLMPV